MSTPEPRSPPMTHSGGTADGLRPLIRDIPFAMLTTRGTDGVLHCRPMATQEEDDGGTLWFFTDSTTHKAEDIAANPQVNVSYCDLAIGLFVSVSGHAEIIEDRAMVHQRWRPKYADWIALDIDDPHMALLRIRIDRIEHWGHPSAWIGRSIDCCAGHAHRDRDEGRRLA